MLGCFSWTGETTSGDENAVSSTAGRCLSTLLSFAHMSSVNKRMDLSRVVVVLVNEKRSERVQVRLYGTSRGRVRDAYRSHVCHMTLFINCSNSTSFVESIPCSLTALRPVEPSVAPADSLVDSRCRTNGGRGLAGPSLNTLPVCSIIRVESTLCATVCNLREWKYLGLHSLNGFASRLTVYMSPALVDPSSIYPSAKCRDCNRRKLTVTFSTKTMLKIPRTAYKSFLVLKLGR